MIKNYIKIAWRNIKKNKVYSSINILGLAVGMAVTMLIGLWIADELNYNSYFKNKDTVAQFMQHQTFNGRTGTGTAMPRPLEFVLREQYGSYFKHIAMSSWENTVNMKFGEKRLIREGIFIQKSGLDIFNIKLLKGVKEDFAKMDVVLISETLAKDFFGNEEPMGKTIRIDNNYDMVVAGVFEKIPFNNSFHEVDYLMPWDKYVSNSSWVQNSKTVWGDNSWPLFVQINDNTSFDAINPLIKDIKKKGDPELVKFNPELFLFPMDQWRLYSRFRDGKQDGGRIQYIWIFGIIGVFVLLLACINFINLSTARSEQRATEVGIRKSIGSKRSQLITQFLSESFLMVCLSFVLAVLLVLLFLGGFNSLAEKQISFPWFQPSFWGIIILFVTVTSMLSGSYPALFLSSFNPVTVLKGTFKTGRYSSLPRKILVVLQFTFSVGLIIGTMIVIQQIEHTKNRPIGYDTNGIVELTAMSREFTGKFDAFSYELKATGAVVEMSTSSSPITQVWSNRGGYTWDGISAEFQPDFAYTEVSHDFMNVLNAQFVEGRNFSHEFATDSTAVILNETAVAYMGIKDPVGKYIKDENGENGLKIIGVVKDMIVQSPFEPVKQAMYVFDRNNNFNYFNIKLHPDQSVNTSLTTIENIYKKHFPNAPFDYNFVDQNFAEKFEIENRISAMAKIFTLLAILISCLGLFGLAAFVVERRTKELGVRKVLGATVKQIWFLVSKDFLMLIGISFIIAFPIAFLMMNKWLQNYSYRTEITWEVFVLAGLGTLFITVLVTSTQAIKAALSNPVKAIKTE